LEFHPWGPWHAGKYITHETKENHYINILTNMTGCYDHYDPRIQAWHDQNQNGKFPSAFPNCQYQMMPIGEVNAMGNFHPRDFHSRIPPFRTLDTTNAKSWL
jgi:hypothetical protein